jgi:3',5'-cyclic AMP phosphodiesterase CpdA
MKKAFSLAALLAVSAISFWQPTPAKADTVVVVHHHHRYRHRYYRNGHVYYRYYYR